MNAARPGTQHRVTTMFEPLPLPRVVAAEFRRRLYRAHAEEPFSTLDPRATVRRVAGIADELELTATIYRGGVDLFGVEVDHVWLAVGPHEAEPDDAAPRVVDASFPLFADDFILALRGFVAGDLSAEALAAAASLAGVDQRVVGVFPPPIRYLGMPVWSSAS